MKFSSGVLPNPKDNEQKYIYYMENYDPRISQSSFVSQLFISKS